MTDLPCALHATVQSIEGDVCLLQTQDGQTIRWPKKLIPTADPGDKVELLALMEEDTNAHREALAKQVLSEMLGGE